LRILLAVFRRHEAEGNWLYPLLGSLALFVFVAIALYVLTSIWRERVAALAGEQDAQPDTAGVAAAAASSLSLTPIEILDRRLAAGEITIEQYDELIGVLNRRYAAAAWNGPEKAAV
jgi:uncharacterized membrane protein